MIAEGLGDLDKSGIAELTFKGPPQSRPRIALVGWYQTAVRSKIDLDAAHALL
jgi:hypothetical protein